MSLSSSWFINDFPSSFSNVLILDLHSHIPQLWNPEAQLPLYNHGKWFQQTTGGTETYTPYSIHQILKSIPWFWEFSCHCPWLSHSQKLIMSIIVGGHCPYFASLLTVSLSCSYKLLSQRHIDNLIYKVHRKTVNFTLYITSLKIIFLRNDRCKFFIL